MALGVGNPFGSGGLNFGGGGNPLAGAGGLGANPLAGIGFPSLFPSGDKPVRAAPLATPLLAPVAPPRSRTVRSKNPFDFFGTLFTPSTQALNQNA